MGYTVYADRNDRYSALTRLYAAVYIYVLYNVKMETTHPNYHERPMCGSG